MLRRYKLRRFSGWRVGIMPNSYYLGPSVKPDGLERNDKSHPQTGFWALTLGSIGVVYGDIGTSPLYALREAVLAATPTGVAASEQAILGILSLIIWALLLVVTAKYVLILLRADNKGEGGTLALMALASRALLRRGGVVIFLGIISGALFYGDAIITPALSVLSAIEGLKIATPAFDAYIVPLTVLILVLLFAVQSRGTAKVAAFFGPITLVWFAAIAVAGVWHVAQNLTVLLAFNPWYGASTLSWHHWILHARRRLSCSDRRRSPVCRPWSFWTESHPLGVAGRHIARAHHQLSWTRRIGPRESEVGGKSVLSALSRLGIAANGPARHNGNGHCKSGRHHRGLFVDEAGHPTWSPATSGNSSHFRSSVRSNLYAASQHVPSCWCVALGGAVPLVECTRLRLRDRCDRHDGGNGNDGDYSHLGVWRWPLIGALALML